MQFLKCAAAILLAGPIFGSAGNPETGITVHEWGTFTTVANEAGGEQPWTPLNGKSDLPCFVQHLHNVAYKFGAPEPMTVTVRMETPVLYFYSQQKTNVSVAVDFPKGLITEWYPHASVIRPELQGLHPVVAGGHIEWNSVDVMPGNAVARLPQGSGASPYYPARDTDSALLRIGGDEEKLLFYRGVANFPVPLNARFLSDRAVELRSTADQPLAMAMLFENRGGRIGYRLMHGLSGQTEVETPALTADLPSLKRDLADALTEQGLFPKEAAAMVATWSDSWFEEGMRVFYLVPRAIVDSQLPLTIKPAPAATARVFVGRLELLSPYLRDQLATAMATGKTQTLDRFGRFLAPFMDQVKVDPAPPVTAYLFAKAKEARQEYQSPTCVR